MSKSKQQSSSFMESPPPYHRSSPQIKTKETPCLSIELPIPSPKSSLSPKRQTPLRIRELLLLSPSPLRRSKTRLTERLEMAEEPLDSTGSRRKCKNRSVVGGLGGCASPRNGRRLRRRLEHDIRDDKDVSMMEEMAKPRKIRQSRRSKKEKPTLVASVPSPEVKDDDGCNLDGLGHLLTDLIMWKDVSKSSLWFGFGSLSFLSSCFAKGVNLSIFSLISQLGLLFLGISFFSSSICQRDTTENMRERKLKEDDILRAARVILPAVNLAISKTRGIFSGEPSMTLKVAPFLLLGAEYGHLITLWRLCALGFFTSFTGPKLYSHYSVQINKRVEGMKLWVLETWGACSHKKIVAASAATAFWNLTTIKTRIFAAFISLVIVRYCRQFSEAKLEGDDEEEGQLQQALVVVESGSQKM